MLDKSPFKSETKEERQQRENLEKEFNDYFNKLVETGKQLLADNRYKEFKKIFETVESNAVEMILNYETKDIEEFYMYVMRLQERIKNMRLLVREAKGMVENPEVYKNNTGLRSWFMNMFKGGEK